MGFKLLNVEERFKQEAALGLRGYGKKAVAEARARIEDALKGNNNPTVHSYDDTDPGLLLLLDRVADVDQFDGAIPRDHDAMDALEDLAAAIPTVSLVYPANSNVV